MGFHRLGEGLGSFASLGKSRQEFRWNQEASFAGGTTTPYPTGFDAIVGAAANVAIVANRFEVTLAGVGSEANGRFDDPNAETLITVEYELDPNNIVIPAANSFVIMQANSGGPGGIAFLQFLRNTGGQLQMFSAYFTDAPAQVNFSTININPSESALHKIQWRASSGVGANDGLVRAFLNGSLQDEATGFDNDQHNVNSVQHGSISSVDAGTTGTFSIVTPRWVNRFI